MSHVDEGRLQAWVDGAYPPGDAEGTEIAAHVAACAECRAAADAAERLRERAGEVLRQMAPDAVRVEPFEHMIAARRARNAGLPASGAGAAASRDAEDQPARAGVEARPGARRRMMPLAWAASIMLAITAGWLARDQLGLGSDAFDPAASVSTAEAPAEAQSEQELARGAADADARNEVAAPPPERLRDDAAARQRLADEQGGNVAQAGEERRQAAAATTRAAVPELARKAADAVGGAQAEAVRAAPPAAVLVAPSEAGRLLAASATGEWQDLTIEEATAAFGRAPFAIDGIALASMQRMNTDGTAVLRVRQELGDGAVIEIVQRAAALALDELVVTGVREQREEQDARSRDVLAQDSITAITVARTGYTLVLRGPVSADSLRALAARLR